MDRLKPPVLTSPWKIGFFVALMLVTISIGAAYFVAKSFGVVWPPLASWGWEGVFQGTGFVFSLTPIIVMVVLSSLITYLLITAAVRKYRRYLDSGKDYRHLMQTLSEIEDLDDPEQLALLDNYEELREFLAGVRDEMVRRRENLNEREKALESAATDAARGREEEVSHRVNEQSQFIVTAVSRRPSGDFGDLEEVTLPALKKVEEAVRTALRSTADNATPQFATDPSFERELNDVMREIESSSRAAHDIEQELQRLAVSGMPGAPDAGEVRRGLDALITSFEALDGLSQSLRALGEEAKGMAINTAMHAGSGNSSQADVVRLAEDVKGVAARFKETAQAFTGLTRELRGALTNVEVSLGDMMAGANSYEGSAIGSLADRMGHWAERSTRLCARARELAPVEEAAEDMSDFERHDNPFESNSFSSFEPQSPMDGGVQELQTLDVDGSSAFETNDTATAPESGGFETTSRDEPVAEFEPIDSAAPMPDDELQTIETGPAPTAAFEPLADEDEASTEFETLDNSASLLEDPESPATTPLEGIKNEERGVFDEMSTQDEMFAELDADGSDPMPQAGVESSTVDTAHRPAATGDGEFVGEGVTEWDDEPASASVFDASEPAVVTDAADAEELPTMSDVGSDANLSHTALEDNVVEDDGVVDLYMLGALDFDPAVHQ